jgi:hypothetical protein
MVSKKIVDRRVHPERSIDLPTGRQAGSVLAVIRDNPRVGHHWVSLAANSAGKDTQ